MKIASGFGLVVVGTLACVGPARAAEDPAAVVVAVTYFDNTSNQVELDALRKGIADMLITDLTQVDGLKVVEREHLEQLLKEIKLGKGPFLDPKTAQKMGRGLGAGLIVAGSFLTLAPELRIDARVVEVETGEVLASASAAGPVGEFFKVQSDLALKLIAAIGAKVTPMQKSRILRPPTRSLEAITQYSRGLDAVDAGDARAAQSAFGKALAADPEFARAQERLAALEKRVGELEQRTTTLESSGGYNLRASTPEEFFANTSTAIMKSDVPKTLEFFFAGWKAAHAKGGKLPLLQFLKVLQSLGWGAGVPEERLREVLDTLGRHARDTQLAPDLRALYALLANNAESFAILTALAEKDGFAAWCLGLHAEAKARAASGAAQAPSEPRKDSASQRALMLGSWLPVLPMLESCGASKWSIALCVSPAPIVPEAGSILAWTALARRHAPRMRAFVVDTASGSFDANSMAVVRRYLAVSMGLIEQLTLLAGAHDLYSLVTEPAPGESGGAAFAARLARVIAARPNGTMKNGDSRPASFLEPMNCGNKGGPAWTRIREGLELTEAEIADDEAKVILWSPRKLCEAFDAAVRWEALRRYMDSRAWMDLTRPPFPDALGWPTLDALDALQSPGSVKLDKANYSGAAKVTCAEVIARLGESATEGAGPPSIERIAVWSEHRPEKCGLLPRGDTVSLLEGCKANDARKCLDLALAHAKAIALPSAAEDTRGFWGRAGKVLRARCAADRPFCVDLGEIYLEAVEIREANDPRRPLGRALLSEACVAGEMQGCVSLAAQHVEGLRLAASQELAVSALTMGLTAAERACAADRPCLAQVDAARRCAAGDVDYCGALVWIYAGHHHRRKDATGLRAEAAAAERDMAKGCNATEADPALCQLSKDPQASIAVPIAHHSSGAHVTDEIEAPSVAPIARLCQDGNAGACALQSDYEAIRAARLGLLAQDKAGEAQARSAGVAAWGRAVEGWEKACKDSDGKGSDNGHGCPRWMALAARCAKADTDSCQALTEEVQDDLVFRHLIILCRDADRKACRVTDELSSIRASGVRRHAALARRCKGHDAHDLRACELSKNFAPMALPHLPELVRPLAAKLCETVTATCKGANPPSYCHGSAMKETLCPPW